VAMAGAKLPLVEAKPHEIREWLQPEEVREALKRQPLFIRPHFESLRRTLLFTVAPASYFLGHVLPKASRAGQALSCCLCAVLCLVALVAAAFRNPGVVPRAAHDGQNNIPAARFVTVNGVSVKQRWCTTCRVYRPLRSKHCSYCDRCVFRFDHHCTWLGNCVGLGNYRSFLVLVIAATCFFGQSAVIALQVLRKSYSEVASGASVAGKPAPVPKAVKARAGDAESSIVNALRRFFLTSGVKERKRHRQRQSEYVSSAAHSLRSERKKFGEVKKDKKAVKATAGDTESSMVNVVKRFLVTNGFKFLYIIYAFGMCIAFSVLLLYHLVIIGCNLTTNEHVRDYYLQRNPFDVTCAANYQQILCSPYGRQPNTDAAATG